MGGCLKKLFLTERTLIRVPIPVTVTFIKVIVLLIAIITLDF